MSNKAVQLVSNALAQVQEVRTQVVSAYQEVRSAIQDYLGAPLSSPAGDSIMTDASVGFTSAPRRPLPPPPIFRAPEYKDENKDEDEDKEARSTQRSLRPRVKPAQPQAKSKKRSNFTRKSRKDPNAPKRPTNPYLVYQAAVLKDVRAAHKDMPYLEVAAEIGKMWKALTPEQRKPYIDRSKELQDDYKKAKAQYDKTLSATPASTSSAHPSTSKDTTDDQKMLEGGVELEEEEPEDEEED